MSQKRVGFVIAHYHPQGRLSESLAAVLTCLAERAIPAVLVSTNLAEEERAFVPPATIVLKRDNVGYDFYSYRVGLDAIAAMGDFDFICILNTSIIVVDAPKFVDGFLRCLDGSSDAVGMTLSRECAFHLQSYLIGFSRKILQDPAFRQWWADMTPISERGLVIVQYELGLSRFLLNAGYTLGSAFHPSNQARLRALCRAIAIGFRNKESDDGDTVTLHLSEAETVNPTHFMWDELLDKFAFVKRELVEKNPFRLDLSSLHAAYGPRLTTL